MAHDALALMTYLGWSASHIVGVSMGGMIAQELALLAPHRVISLALLVTHAGGMRSFVPWTGISRFARYVRVTWRRGFFYYLHESHGGLLRTDYHEVWSVWAHAGVARRAILFRSQSPQGTEAAETFENIMHMLYDPKSLAQRPVFDRLLAQHQRSRARNLLPSWRGILGQLCAVMFHHVSFERLQLLGLEKFAKLVIGVPQDHLVRPANSRFLAAALGVPLYVVHLAAPLTLPTCPAFSSACFVW
jgi:pimeloyl-ACP methyl ester carboxylesterase